MESNRIMLQKAIEMVTHQEAAKGIHVTAEEMARKTGIAEAQWHAYLDDQEETPADLASKLRAAYDIKIVVVQITDTEEVDEELIDQATRAENSRGYLQGLIVHIKNSGKAKRVNITEEEIALKMGISHEQLIAYITGAKNTPVNLCTRLWTAYADLLNTVQAENNRASLEGTIVLIRNQGLAEKRLITMEDMARAIGISGAQLYAYVKDEYNAAVTGDWSYQLRTAYEALLKDAGEVEIIEDLNMIVAAGMFGEQG